MPHHTELITILCVGFVLAFVLGMLNENATVVTRGLTGQDELLLATPPEPGKLTIVRLEGGH